MSLEYIKKEIEKINPDLCPLLDERDGAFLLVKKLTDSYTPVQVSSPGPGDEQRAWELAGNFYQQQGRFHEAILIYIGESIIERTCIAHERDHLPPFGKGGLGGFYKRRSLQIPLNPPLLKGDFGVVTTHGFVPGHTTKLKKRYGYCPYYCGLISKTKDAEREQLKVFQDRGMVIIVVDENDLKEVADGKNFITMLRKKYERVRLDLRSQVLTISTNPNRLK